MRYISFFSIAVISSALFFSSCSKSSSTPEPTPVPSTFTFKVGGVGVTVDSANAVLYNLGVAPFNREIDVYAFKAGQQVLEMHFKPTAGTYNASTSFDGAWLSYDEGIDTYDSQSGSLVLTTCDTISNKIAGTFNFTGKLFTGSATKNITEGTLLVTKLRKQ